MRPTCCIQTMVCVVTSHDIHWHLDTSLDRVILQLMPSMVWTGMRLGRSPR
jgi:hypothetical protein